MALSALPSRPAWSSDTATVEDEVLAQALAAATPMDIAAYVVFSYISMAVFGRLLRCVDRCRVRQRLEPPRIPCGNHLFLESGDELHPTKMPWRFSRLAIPATIVHVLAHDPIGIDDLVIVNVLLPRLYSC